MPADPVTPPRPNARRIRRWSLAAAALLALTGGLVIGRSGAPHRAPRRSPPVLTLRAGDRLLARVPLERFEQAGDLDRRSLSAAALGRVPLTSVASTRAATITYRYDRDAVRRSVDRLSPLGGAIQVPTAAVASNIRAPVIGQRLKNNCEATALEILLKTSGVDADQITLQARLAKSGPLDPRGSGPEEVWGDPELGFVGRADGGGTSGGFGVYQHPVQALARSYARALEDISGATPGKVYRRLLAGHAVMAWVGLSNGPFAHWRTPAGRTVTANFGEHSVVLTGVAGNGDLTVHNPLHGTIDTWTRRQFESMWALLGRRALSA